MIPQSGGSDRRSSDSRALAFIVPPGTRALSSRAGGTVEGDQGREGVPKGGQSKGERPELAASQDPRTDRVGKPDLEEAKVSRGTEVGRCRDASVRHLSH